MNTTVEKVKQAQNPQHAMLAIAATLDEIKQMLAPLMQPRVIMPADPWGDWDSTTDTVYSEEPRDDNRAVIEAGGDVVVKPVSKERQHARAAYAMDSRLHEFYGDSLSAADFCDAYVKGGPRWLYYTNRECVMQMPLNYRRALVADILLDSPSEADEIGRDILKFDESVPQGEAVEQQRAAREFGPAYKG